MYAYDYFISNIECMRKLLGTPNIFELMRDLGKYGRPWNDTRIIEDDY